MGPYGADGTAWFEGSLRGHVSLTDRTLSVHLEGQATDLHDGDTYAIQFLTPSTSARIFTLTASAVRYEFVQPNGRLCDRDWGCHVAHVDFTEVEGCAASECVMGEIEHDSTGCAPGSERTRSCTPFCTRSDWSMCGQWTQIATPSDSIHARFDHAAVWTGSEMIVLGGRDAASTAIIDVAAYDPATDRWRALPDVPKPSSPPALAVSTGNTVVFFGDRGYELDLRDPSSLTWSELAVPSFEFPHRFASSCIFASTTKEVLVWGGVATTLDKHFSDGAAWSSVTRTWRRIASAPLSARSSHSTIWDGRRMIVAGGADDTTHFGDAAAYDPSTDSWQALGKFAPPDATVSMVHAGGDGLAFVFGGTDTMRFSDFGAFLRGTTWTPILTPPRGVLPLAARTSGVAWLDGGDFYFFGGENGAILADGATYSPITTMWRALPRKPPASTHSSVVWTGDRAILWGGLTKDGPSRAGWIFRR